MDAISRESGVRAMRMGKAGGGKDAGTILHFSRSEMDHGPITTSRFAGDAELEPGPNRFGLTGRESLC